MCHTYAFFDLNYHFAQRIAAVTGMPLAEALLNYTHLYLAFGLSRSFDPTAPAWVEFLAGLPTVDDPVAWIEQTYLRLAGDQPPFRPERPFGCFYYAIWDDGRIRLHFWTPPEVPHPLSREQAPQRRAELAALLADVRANVPGARTLVGGSWLYNIEAYRRLFPAEYLATAHPEEPEPQFIAQWGQLIDHRRQVKPHLAQAFLNEIARRETLEDLLLAFPFRVLRLEAPLDVFDGK